MSGEFLGTSKLNVLDPKTVIDDVAKETNQFLNTSLGDTLDDDGTDHAAYDANIIGWAHQNGRISGRDVQMVYVEAWNGGELN